MRDKATRQKFQVLRVQWLLAYQGEWYPYLLPVGKQYEDTVLEHDRLKRIIKMMQQARLYAPTTYFIDIFDPLRNLLRSTAKILDATDYEI